MINPIRRRTPSPAPAAKAARIALAITALAAVGVAGMAREQIERLIAPAGPGTYPIGLVCLALAAVDVAIRSTLGKRLDWFTLAVTAAGGAAAALALVLHGSPLA